MRSKLIILLTVFFISVDTVSAQDTLTSDGLFLSARKAAFDDKNYEQAKKYLHKGLAISPAYSDLRIFLGRIHAWEKNYDSARYHFDIVIAKDPSNTDALLAYIDAEYWADNYTKALKLTETGMTTGKMQTEFLLRKARIASAQGKNSALAKETLHQLAALKSNDTRVRPYIQRLDELTSVNSVGVAYDYLHFQNQFPDPWHLIAVSYGRRTNIGSFTARVNYANRFGKSGYQYELDAYPRFSKTFYSYMSVGYSDDVGVFPAWRAGFSLYANLPASYEAEVGVRYLYFSDPTFVYTVYAGKYFSNFLLGARAYLTPSDNNVSQSYNISARYYYSGADYLGLTLGTGISPDDRSQINQFNTNYKLKSYRAALNFKKSFGGKHIFDMNFSLNNQEYQPSKKDNQLQAGIGYQFRF